MKGNLFFSEMYDREEFKRTVGKHISSTKNQDEFHAKMNLYFDKIDSDAKYYEPKSNKDLGEIQKKKDIEELKNANKVEEIKEE